ncbi:MAG: hypothetical protein WC222_10920 [Parachlamydiales bacterium]
MASNKKTNSSQQSRTSSSNNTGRMSREEAGRKGAEARWGKSYENHARQSSKSPQSGDRSLARRSETNTLWDNYGNQESFGRRGSQDDRFAPRSREAPDSLSRYEAGRRGAEARLGSRSSQDNLNRSEEYRRGTEPRRAPNKDYSRGGQTPARSNSRHQEAERRGPSDRGNSYNENYGYEQFGRESNRSSHVRGNREDISRGADSHRGSIYYPYEKDRYDRHGNHPSHSRGREDAMRGRELNRYHPNDDVNDLPHYESYSERSHPGQGYGEAAKREYEERWGIDYDNQREMRGRPFHPGYEIEDEFELDEIEERNDPIESRYHHEEDDEEDVDLYEGYSRNDEEESESRRYSRSRH